MWNRQKDRQKTLNGATIWRKISRAHNLPRVLSLPPRSSLIYAKTTKKRSTQHTVYKDFLFKSQMYKVGCQKAFGSIHLRVQTRLVPLTELIWTERVPGAEQIYSDYFAFSCSVSERVSDKAIYRVVLGKLKKRLLNSFTLWFSVS